MAHYRGTIFSPKSAEEVFDYMAMFSNVSKWDPTAAEARPIGDNPPAKGARFYVLVRWMGREIPLEYTTTAYERPKRVVLRAENASTISEDTVTIESTAAGCEMTYDAQLRLKGAMRLIDPLFGFLFKRLGDNAAAGLRRELAGQASKT
ncbi:MAG: SRPBCC family protein [Dehalococcoidia bacterium]